MILFNLTPAQLHDLAGLPLGYAQMQFDLIDSNTPTPIYQDATTGTVHTNPVVADDTGLFPPIYVEAGISYRIRLYAQNGTVASPLYEVEYVPTGGDVTEYTIGTAGAVLGLLNGNNTHSGNLTLSGTNAFTGTETHSGSVTFSGATALPAAATVGGFRAGFRGIPTSEVTTDYTLVLTDAGKGKRKTGSSAINITIPPNSSVPFPTGTNEDTVIYFRNKNATANLVIVRGSGVTLRIAGAITDQDVTISPWGEGTITKEGTDEWVFRGTSAA